MSFAAIPGANAQTYSGPQSYQGNLYSGSMAGAYGPAAGNYAPQAQGNAYPNSTMGSPGSATGNYAPQAQGNAYPNSMGSPESTTGNYAPQNNQGSSSPNGSEGSVGSTTGNYTPRPSAAGLGDTEAVTNGPQGSPPSNWSARRNVVESERYDRLLESSRGFREARMRRECGPITDPQLHQQCLDSFAQYEPAGGNMPASGSSTPSRHYRSNSGR